MKSQDEFLQTVRDKAEKYEAERKRRNRAIRNLSLLFAACLAISLTAYLGRGLIGSMDTSMGEVPSNAAVTTTPLATEAGLTDGPTGAGTEKIAEDTLSGNTTATHTTVAQTTVTETTAVQTTVAQTTGNATMVVSTHAETTVATGTPTAPEAKLWLNASYELGAENFKEKMLCFSDREAMVECLGGKVDVRGYPDELFEEYAVYAVWVENRKLLQLGGLAELDGEMMLRLIDSSVDSSTGKNLVLVVVSREIDGLAACITHGGNIIRLKEN